MAGWIALDFELAILKIHGYFKATETIRKYMEGNYAPFSRSLGQQIQIMVLPMIQVLLGLPSENEVNVGEARSGMFSEENLNGKVLTKHSSKHRSI